MELKLIANHLVPDDEVWVSPKTWEKPFSLKAMELNMEHTDYSLCNGPAGAVRDKKDFDIWWYNKAARQEKLSAEQQSASPCNTAKPQCLCDACNTAKPQCLCDACIVENCDMRGEAVECSGRVADMQP